MPQRGKPRILAIKFFQVHPQRVPDSLYGGVLGAVIAIVMATLIAALPVHRISCPEINAAESIPAVDRIKAEMRKAGVGHRQKQRKGARPLAHVEILGFEPFP